MSLRNLIQMVCLAVAVTTTGQVQVQAGFIGFEDLTTRNNFGSLGINNTYQGYGWGFGLIGGVNNRDFNTSDDGWASATVSDPADFPAPSNMSGTSYAWNWNGVQSLWIDFRGLRSVDSIKLAILSSAYSFNASSVKLFGYDDTSTLMASSSAFALSSDFQTYSLANFSSVRYLEIRADQGLRWFSVDDIEVNDVSAVPEPASMVIWGIGALGMVSVARRRARKVATV